MIARSCPQCGRDFEARSPRARYCSSTCRSRAHRGHAPTPATTSNSDRAASRWLILPTVEEQMRAAGMTDTPTGRTALSLAERLDALAPTESPAAVANLTRELTRALDAVKRQAPTESDNPLTRLRLRRMQAEAEAKAEAAGADR